MNHDLSQELRRKRLFIAEEKITKILFQLGKGMNRVALSIAVFNEHAYALELPRKVLNNDFIGRGEKSSSSCTQPTPPEVSMG